MFIIECKNFYEYCHEGDVLYLSGNECVVQRNCSEFVLKDKPFGIWSDDEVMEVYIEVDEKVLKLMEKFLFLKVFESTLENDDIVYTFQSGEFMTWDSMKPPHTCSIVSPSIKFLDEDEIVEVGVENKKFFVKGKDFCETFHIIHEGVSQKVFIKLKYLMDFFNQNPKILMKLHIKEDCPLYIECYDRTRLYIAPVMEEV